MSDEMKCSRCGAGAETLVKDYDGRWVCSPCFWTAHNERVSAQIEERASLAIPHYETTISVLRNTLAAKEQAQRANEDEFAEHIATADSDLARLRAEIARLGLAEEGRDAALAQVSALEARLAVEKAEHTEASMSYVKAAGERSAAEAKVKALESALRSLAEELTSCALLAGVDTPFAQGLSSAVKRIRALASSPTGETTERKGE